MGSSINLEEMKEYSQKFVNDREWNKYHTPKNIAMGITIEASELMEIFQWLTEKESFEIKNDPKRLEKVKDEMGDVFHLLVRLSTLLNIDLIEAFWDKIRKNETKYPIELAKGRTEKYTELLNG
ncbi:MAG: nucleotide pyrophosphohydrolase [Parachlamydiales bacterium]